MFSLLRKLRNIFRRGPSIEELTTRVNELNKNFHAMTLEHDMFSSAISKELEEYINGEIGRHMDDLDIDSLISPDNLNEMIADVLRDELSGARIKLEI